MQNKETLIYQFKITLNDSNPSIWRRFQVESHVSLHRLSAIILAVMGWAGGHLHQFCIGGKFYDMPNKELEPTKAIDERMIRLSDFSKENISKFEYQYDMGDSWEHLIELEKVFQPDKNTAYPVCIDGARKCPPENCGGIGGYEDFLKAIQDTKHPQHKSMLNWIGGKFDPEDFSIKNANKSLKDINEAELLLDELE